MAAKKKKAMKKVWTLEDVVRLGRMTHSRVTVRVQYTGRGSLGVWAVGLEQGAVGEHGASAGSACVFAGSATTLSLAISRLVHKLTEHRGDQRAAARLLGEPLVAKRKR